MATKSVISPIGKVKFEYKESDIYKGLLKRRDLSYTLLPGEIKKNYCKIITNARIFLYDKPFILDLLKEKIVTHGKKPVAHQSKGGFVRKERIGLTSEEADTYVNEMLQKGYIRYVTTVRRDKTRPNIPEAGVKIYIFDKFRVIECEESKSFQAKQRRLEAASELKSKLNERRCKALNQLYAQFGATRAFTYEMVREIPKFYSKMAESKEASDKSKVYYKQAAQYIESSSADFLDTWNSLIRNNYIIPHRIRTKDGVIKISPGTYRVNMNYVTRCLSEVTM